MKQRDVCVQRQSTAELPEDLDIKSASLPILNLYSMCLAEVEEAR